MSAYKFTFIWEETDELDYDELFQQLMMLGAEDIIEEEYERPAPEPRGARKKKPKHD